MRSVWSAAVVAAVLVSAAAAQGAERLVTEIYTVGFRPVGELVALVRPLVPAPGTVVAHHDKLIVKATESTQADVRRILAEVDRAPANLMVSVRHSLTVEVQRDLDQVFARVHDDEAGVSVGRDPGPGSNGLRVRVGGGDAAVGARVARTRRSDDDRDVQRIRVLEGQEAFIETGVSVPTAERTVIVTDIGAVDRRGTRYRDATKGFYVRPRITPRGVSVEVTTHRDTVGGRGGGAFGHRSSATTVSGPLGRWMQVAGSSEASERSASGIARSTGQRASTDYAIYLKVERLPD